MISYHPALCSNVFCSMISLFMAFVFTILANFSDETSLKRTTRHRLRESMKSSQHDIRVYYSARGVLRLVLEQIYLNKKVNQETITIACNSIHAKPMQKAIKSFLSDHPNCEIKYVYIKMNSDYSFDDIPDDLTNCDLLILYHLWGLAYDFDNIIQIAKTSNIFVFEDLVQGGGMVPFSKDPFLGHGGSDIIVWSGALDKTISTLGNGFFIDKNEFLTDEFISQHSNGTRTSCHRFHKLLWGVLGYIILNNPCQIWKLFTILLQLFGYSVMDAVNWSLVNRSKSFDHGVTLAQPSLAALYSIRFTIWFDDYTQMERSEKNKLMVFRQCLSDDAWTTLFPHLAGRKSDKTDYFDKGISECFYCFDAFKNLKPFLDKHGFICVPQQSWMAFADDKPESSEQKLLDGMLLLPNFHNLNNQNIRTLAELLTKYCLTSNTINEK